MSLDESEKREKKVKEKKKTEWEKAIRESERTKQIIQISKREKKTAFQNRQNYNIEDGNLLE